MSDVRQPTPPCLVTAYRQGLHGGAERIDAPCLLSPGHDGPHAVRTPEGGTKWVER